MNKIIFSFIFIISHVHARTWNQVQDIFQKALNDQLFSGASLYVGSSEESLFTQHIGASKEESLYDVASLTKVVATTTSVMILEENGLLSLRDKVSKYISCFGHESKNMITLEDLMRHQGGLVAGMLTLSNENLDSFIERICARPLSYHPGSKTVYSDLGFILLGRIVELVSGKSLSTFSDENIFAPLKMTSTFFTVPSHKLHLCLPTRSEKNCLPHDPTVHHFYPQSMGSAGVFTTLSDLSRFGRMILNLGELDGIRILSRKTVEKMTHPRVLRGLGWDVLSGYSNGPRGDIFPEGISFGHTGYTGTILWIDPQSQTYYIFLSNRTYKGDERTKRPYGVFRKNLSTAIGKEIYFLSEYKRRVLNHK